MVKPLDNHWVTTKRIPKYMAGIMEFGIEFKPSLSLAINGLADAD